jgi:NitT/TauT family transport system substrate-binding protein
MKFRPVIALTAAMAWLVAASPAGAADRVMFQLGFLPNGLDACYYLGVQQGLYKAADLDVTILHGRGATDTLAKVGTGVADLGEVTLDAFLAAKAEGPVPVTAVMSMLTKPPDSILTTTTSGIVTLKDLVGRKVATSPFTSSNLVWPVILKLNGIDPASVTLIKSDANTLPGMLATGQVDAIIGWATTSANSGHVLASQGKTMKLIPWSESGHEGYSQAVVASDKMLAERPDVARRFIKVSLNAMKLVYEDTARAADAMKAGVPQGELSVFKSQIETTRAFMFNEISERDGLGAFTPGQVKKTWDWVSRANNYPADKIDPMTVVTTKFVSN